MSMNFTEWAHHKHDVFANQKYGGNLPYSFHLKAVRTHATKLCGMINDDMFNNQALLGNNYLDASDFTIVGCTADGHDLIEDARQTYNDIKNKASSIGGVIGSLATQIADAIFACTESTGRNRTERHDAAYIARLISLRNACIAKIADISANVLFGITTGSDMPSKMKKEWFGVSAIPELPETHTGLRKQIITAYPELRSACVYLDDIFQLVN